MSKNKIVTFSFDDGNLDDIRLIGILNKYGLKATFNLNSGLLSCRPFWEYESKKVFHINASDIKIYKGHEVAAHSYSHPNLNKLDNDTLHNEVVLDLLILKNLLGCDVKGFAYPGGTYSDRIVEELKNHGLKYARTINSTYNFERPQNPFILNPTCHFRDSKLSNLVENFLSLSTNDIVVFNIWGHSYELLNDDDWKEFEEFCRVISGHEDILYCTNIQMIERVSTDIIK